MDELFEVATLIQTGKIKNFPIVLLGVSYWTPLLCFLRDSLLRNAAIEQKDLDRILLTDSPTEAVAFIQRAAVGELGLRYAARPKPRKVLWEGGVELS